MINQLTDLQPKALADLAAAASAAALEDWRVAYLGRKGALAGAMQGLGALPADERPAAGQAANQVKAALEAAWTARKAAWGRTRRRRWKRSGWT